MDIFNNREIALLIWAGLALGWGLSKMEIRNGLRDVFVAGTAKPLLKIYTVMFSYIFGMIYLLYEIGLWDFEQTKTTLIWTFSAALISLFRHDEIQEDSEYFKKALRDNLNLVIVIEFIVTFYSFPIIAELVLVPISAFLGAVYAYSGFHERYKPVEKLMEKVFFIFGLFMIVYAGHNIILHLSEFATVETLTDFYTPPVLSILFLPFVYALSVYSAYQRAFIRIRSNALAPDVLHYAKWRSILAFNFRVKLMERWSDTTFLNQLDSKSSVDKTIWDIKELDAYEKNPKVIPIEEGWSPYEAKDFLSEYGLPTGYYKNVGDDEWFVSSTSLDIGDEIIPNYITYYVSGDRYVAKNLKLKLYIHNPQCEKSVPMFIELAEMLLNKALGVEASTNLEEILDNNENVETTFSGKAISISRNDWPNSNTGQYDLSFSLANPEPEP